MPASRPPAHNPRVAEAAAIGAAELLAVEFLLSAAVGVADETEGARLVVTGLPTIIGCEVAVIGLRDNAAFTWSIAAHGIDGRSGDDLTETISPELDALWDRAVARGRLSLRGEDDSLPSALGKLGFDSISVFPIRTTRGCLGLLLVGRPGSEPGETRELDDQLLSTLTGPLALGIENLRLRRGLEETVRDRTAELRLRADELDAARSETERLLDLANAVMGKPDRAKLFDAVSGALSHFVEYDRSALLLYREEIDALEVYALSGPLAGADPRVGTVAPRGSMHVAWRSLEEKRPIVTHDLSEDPATDLDRALAGAGVRAHVAVPLLTDDRVLGMLGVASETPGLYSETDAQLLLRVANQVALAVEKLLAFEEISRLTAQLERENLYLKEEIRTEHDFGEIVGESPALVEVMRAVSTVAPTDASVLITGETGTGKELIARAIHNGSKRSGRALVKVNCAAIPEGLVESELFGHEKGAFTGALTRKMGRFQLADRATIFLDEIGELALGLQSKLLRVLQEGEFERLGSADTRTVDARVIAATNRDLAAEVAAGRFRSDLFYRLEVFPISVPPLRDRGADVRLLVHHFADLFSRKFDRSITSIPRATMDRLAAYGWPGNVRELRNVVERAVILSPGETLELGPWFDAAGVERAGGRPLRLDDVQRTHIIAVLERVSWKVSGPGGAAEILGLKPTTLNHRMKRLGIQRPR